MKNTLQKIFTKIDNLNTPEQIEVFHYLEQKIQQPPSLYNKFSDNSDYQALLEYIEDNFDSKPQRSLTEFRGTLNLLNGEDAQVWVNQQREQW